jgi:hypothetical protein
VFTACGYSDHDICAVNADITFGGNRTQVRFGDAHSWGCRGDFGFGGYHSLNAVGDGYSDWGNAYATCSGHVGPAESIGLIWVR